MADIAQAVVAGHICLDIIPTFEQPVGDVRALFIPGKLVKIGRAVVSTGGAVSNAGIALHRLGVRTRLMGKVGDDWIGHAILDRLRDVDPGLADGMIIGKSESSSYTVVINPPAIDRMFLHCPGANDTFGADDVDYDKLEGARMFHFGYPPVMRRLFEDDGRELETMFRRVKQRGLTTSLDMTMPDPQSDAGRVDWRALLRRVLPHVDIFLPSLEETLFMLHRAESAVTGALLSEVSAQLCQYGAGIVGLKLGDQGLYCRWNNHELIAPCFNVAVAGTTGAGDCTIAGFLAGLLWDLPPDQVMTRAVAVGATCCERPDATSGVPAWAVVQRRLAAGWPRRPVAIPLDGWRWDDCAQCWLRTS